MTTTGSASDRVEPRVLLGVVLAALVVSAIGARNHGTWALEVIPVVLGVVVLVATHRRFPLTPLVHRALAFGALMIALGAHYSYAHVPVGEWLRDWFGFERNHYDRIGHVVQGVVAALVLREVLLRRTSLRPGRWLFGVVTLGCLGFSGGFEVIEALAAAVTGRAGDAYLGTQGSEIDAQLDMLCALVGAVAAQLALRRRHDQRLAELDDPRAVAGSRSVS